MDMSIPNFKEMENRMGNMFKGAVVLILMVVITGCGMARGVHDLRALNQDTPRTNKTVNEIVVYTQDSPPSRPFIVIADVAAHGNGYADNSVLLDILKKETVKVGAEMVMITNKEVTSDEVVGTYGGGFMMTSQIKRPHLYGIAGIYSKVKIGITVGEDGLIRYIAANSSADKAGMKEGMRLLSIKGQYFSGTS